MSRSLSAKQVAMYLNTVLEADPLAVHALLRNVVPCNQALADHPRVPVNVVCEGSYLVTGLGVVNGLLAETGRVVAAEVDGAGLLRRFRPVRQEVGSDEPEPEPAA